MSGKVFLGCQLASMLFLLPWVLYWRWRARKAEWLLKFFTERYQPLHGEPSEWSEDLRRLEFPESRA